MLIRCSECEESFMTSLGSTMFCPECGHVESVYMASDYEMLYGEDYEQP